jgi:hypothetical protein
VLGAYNSLAPEIDLNKEVKRVSGIVDTVEAKSNEAIGKINTVIGTIENKSKELGVAKYALIFQAESTTHGNLAFRWLLAIVIVLFGTLAYVFNVAYGLDGIKDIIQTNNNYVILLITSRILIFTVLTIGVTVCIRNYKAHKHNEVLNKHRYNALVTFETFTTGASGDPQTKSAVLLEATHTIFSNQNTGYGNEGEVEAVSKIIEIVKDIKSN